MPNSRGNLLRREVGFTWWGWGHCSQCWNIVSLVIFHSAFAGIKVWSAKPGRVNLPRTVQFGWMVMIWYFVVSQQDCLKLADAFIGSSCCVYLHLYDVDNFVFNRCKSEVVHEHFNYMILISSLLKSRLELLSWCINGSDEKILHTQIVTIATDFDGHYFDVVLCGHNTAV